MDFSPSFIRQLKKRNQKAFGELYADMADRFYRYLAGRYHLDRQAMLDIVGDFFLKLRDRIDRVDPEKSFEARIWTVFRNFVADYFKNKKTPKRLSALDEMISDPDYTPLEHTQQSSQIKRIYAVLDQFDELSREIVVLKYVEGISYEQIALITGMQTDAVRQRASRAIKKLQEMLG